jgi:hypothetical protein
MRLSLTMRMHRVRDYVRAVRDFPKGIFCGWCGGFNRFYDDCGWFAITPVGDDNRVCCERCYRGPIGEKHIARYGVGDR